MQDFIWHLITASFLFTAAGYAWTWSLYLLLSKKIEEVWVRVTNHQAHRMDDMDTRADASDVDIAALARRVFELENPIKKR